MDWLDVFFKLFSAQSIFLGPKELDSTQGKGQEDGFVLDYKGCITKALKKQMFCLATNGEYTRELKISQVPLRKMQWNAKNAKKSQWMTIWERHSKVTLAFQFLGRLGREDLAHPAFSAQWEQRLFSGIQKLGSLSTEINVCWFEHRTQDPLDAADDLSYWRYHRTSSTSGKLFIRGVSISDISKSTWSSSFYCRKSTGFMFKWRNGLTNLVFP